MVSDSGSVAVSILIPAKSASETTVRTLLTLAAEAAAESLEIVVLVDGDDWSCNEKLLSLGLGSRLKVIYTGCQSRGAAWARNHLASLATGEVLFFVDADVEIPPGFVELALPILENLRDRQIWAPQILPAQALNGPSRFFSRFVLSPKKVETFTIIPSTAFAVRRSAWAVLGGFSELFLEAGGEDWEWIIRNHLHTPGFYVTYDPAFSVLHDNPVSLRELWTRASKYGSAAPLLEAHFAPIDRARFFPPRRGSYVHRFAGSFSALVNLLALRNPRSTGAQVVQWGGRLLTSWDRRDFVSSVFFLLVISLAYRTARHKNLRYLPLSDSEMRQTG